MLEVDRPPDSMTLGGFRREFDGEGIGNGILSLLWRIARATATSYPPSRFTLSGSWGRGELEDVLQEWIMERLLVRMDREGRPRGGGQLAEVRARAGSMDSVRQLLSGSFRHYMADRPALKLGQRPGPVEAINLFRRARKLLQEDHAFTAVGGRARRDGEQMWTLTAKARPEPSTCSVEELTRFASARSDAEWKVARYGPEAGQASPILREPELREFVLFLLDRADGALRLDAIAEVLEARFGLEFAIQSLDPHPHLADLSTVRQLELRDVARCVLAQLGERRASILVAFERADRKFAPAARLLEIDRAIVRREVRAIVEAIVGLGGREDFAPVYQLVVESLFLGEEEE